MKPIADYTDYRAARKDASTRYHQKAIVEARGWWNQIHPERTESGRILFFESPAMGGVTVYAMDDGSEIAKCGGRCVEITPAAM